MALRRPQLSQYRYLQCIISVEYSESHDAVVPHDGGKIMIDYDGFAHAMGTEILHYPVEKPHAMLCHRVAAIGLIQQVLQSQYRLDPAQRKLRKPT